jgi:AraC-like DNA-binding protein
VLRFIRELGANGGVKAIGDYEEDLRKLAQGQAVFLHFSSDGYAWIKKHLAKQTKNVGLCLLPRENRSFIIAGNALAIPRNTRDPQLALKILEFFMDYRTNRRVHAHIDFIWGLNAFKAFGTLPIDNDEQAVFHEIIRHGYSLARVEQYAAIYPFINTEIRALMQGRKSPAQVLKRIYEQFWLYNNKNKYRSFVNEVCRYLEANFTRPCSISDLAARHSVSQRHLNRLFIMEKGVSCKEYLIDLRIKRAGTLLKTTGLPINEIARQTGYADPYEFSRIFKKKTGSSPSTYRHKA